MNPPDNNFDGDRLPNDLEQIATRLRTERAEASGLDLDRIKTRAMAQATSSRPKGIALRSRTTAVFLSLALMVGGTGGVMAAKGGNGKSQGSAGNSQYKPGCGPKKTNGVNPSGTHTGPKKKGRAACPQPK
jgi:hypothetical protein